MKILFFSPHAYYTVHSLPEALVAESLKLSGHEVVTVNCDGVYNDFCLCMPIDIYDNHKNKLQICNKCKKCRDVINKEFDFHSELLNQYISDEEKLHIKNLVENIRRENYMEFLFDGIPVAQFALYEFVLSHKLSNTDIPAPLWGKYKTHLANCLVTLYSITRLIESIKPDRITTYNSLYSVNRIVCAVAERSGISHFTLHAGSHHKNRIQQMTVFKGVESSALINRHPDLERMREIPLCTSQIDLVNSHVSELFEATSPWVYSIKNKKLNSIEIRQLLGISSKQKVLLAVMRSNDERLGATLAGVNIFNAKPIFHSQYQWLKWLADYAKDNPEYFIIFRVHPREYPNKREKVLSSTAIKFNKFIEQFENAENLYINTPNDNFSLHDLLKITDVVLNNTSTVGLEASLFGIPVVGMGDDLYSYDTVMQTESYSKDEYVNNITTAVISGWDFSRVVKAYRWLNYIFSEVAIDISDGYRNRLPLLYNILDLVDRVLRKLHLIESVYSLIGYVKGRSRPLKYSDQLIYAIINDKDSHIGSFSSNNSLCNTLSEKNKIRILYEKQMRQIAHDDDLEFLTKVSRCISE